MPIISLNQVAKSFGSHQILHNITLEVNDGEIFSLLGPSGAGKTTLIKLLTNQESQTAGLISVLGQKPSQFTKKTYQNIGVMSDTSGFYKELSIEDNIMAFVNIYGADVNYAYELMHRVNIFEDKKTLTGKASTDMKQRMLIVRALVNKPRLLFLDEPTSGVDPATSRDIHEILLEQKQSGTSIFMTTHNMREASQLSDQVALLHQGQIVESGHPMQIISKYHKAPEIKFTYQNHIEEDISYAHLSQISPIFNNLATAHSNEPTLEDIFIKLTGVDLNG